MAFAVTKTYIVDTEDIDEAYALTKINDSKVATFAVGQIRPFDPQAANPTPTNPEAQRTAQIKESLARSTPQK